MSNHSNTDDELRNQITEIIYGADWQETEVADAHKPDVEVIMKLVQADRKKRELEVLLSIPLNAHKYYIKGRISELREELGL